ncbi:toluene tolerance ABC transporter, periplasmic substrate-binding protein [gamma proteobacterium HdN1]|nr:toluene tolerance ABC transporter, periplasmic substrate-binding protein [gamma proteobacterium HdN1]
MRMRNLEIMVGAFMVAGFAALVFLALRVSGLAMDSREATYRLSGHFENIGGLTVRAKVTMAGVAIGRVSRIYFDDKNFTAVVEMDINKSVSNISTDATASILTSGLLGEKYIGIVEGAEDEVMKEGDVFQVTNSALVLEDLVGKFLFNKVTEDPKP